MADYGTVIAYSVGIFHVSVCAPTEMAVEDVEEQVNLIIPSAGPPKWHLSHDSKFSDETPNPQPCERMPNRIHRLFSC